MMSRIIPAVMPSVVQAPTTNGSSTQLPNAPQAATSEYIAPQQNLPVTQQEVVPNQVELDSAVDRLNEYMKDSRRDLYFSVDEESGRVIVKVIDFETREVIRQIPSEEIMALAHGLELEESAGTLLNTQA